MANLISHRDASVLCLVRFRQASGAGAVGEALGWTEVLVIVPEHS